MVFKELFNLFMRENMKTMNYGSLIKSLWIIIGIINKYKVDKFNKFHSA